MYFSFCSIFRMTPSFHLSLPRAVLKPSASRSAMIFATLCPSRYREKILRTVSASIGVNFRQAVLALTVPKEPGVVVVNLAVLEVLPMPPFDVAAH